jgi:hypothetical protein
LWVRAADHSRLFADNLSLAARDAAVIDAVVNAAPRPRTERFILIIYLDDLPCLSAEMRLHGTLKPLIPRHFVNTAGRRRASSPAAIVRRPV